MIPRTYPTLIDGRKAGYMRVFYLTSVTGLTKWIDYIPVKTVAFSAAAEGTTNANGHINVVQVASSTALRRWVDYIPVFEDGAATVPWSTNANGYIPVDQMLDLDFRAGILDSRITFTRADASTCATYFDSTGRLQTAAANVARFDYDPAVPNGTTGGELVTPFTSGWVQQGAGAVSDITANGFTSNTTGNGLKVVSGVTTGKTYQVTVTTLSNCELWFGLSGGSANKVTTTGTSTINVGGNTDIFVRASSIGAVSFVGSIKEVTFNPRGLLIEESRTNLLLQSRDMTQAAWTKTDVTPARTQVGLDGVANTACLMTEGSAGTANLSQAGTVSAGATITVSAVLKRGNNDWIRIIAAETTVTDGANAWFNLNTGTVGTVSARGAGTNNSSTITSLGGGWYRCTVTTLPNGTYTSARISVLSASANGAGVLANATYIVDCAQLEVGAFATSIIPTTTTALTRAADSASMTGGTNFSSWFNATQGTFVAEAVTSASGSRGVFSINDGTGNNKSDIRIGTGAANFCSVGGVSQANIGVGISAGAVHKIAHALDASNRYVCVDGAAVASAASLIPSVTALQIGGFDVGTSFQLNGHIRSLRYYPTRLPNATLQALTA